MIAGQSLNVNTVAENFDVSRTAIYKHVKILTECGLITIRQHGRERYYEAQLQKLGEIRDWVDQYRRFWEQKFDNLDLYLEQVQAKPKKNVKGKRLTKARIKKGN